MRRFAYALVASLALALPASADSPSPAPTSTAKPAAVVHIAGFAYKPPTVTIAPGETVLFINDDDDAHTVTATDKTFDSGGMDSHDSWRKTFTKPGRYTYFCALHPYMKAVVVVASSQKGNTP